MKTRGVSLPEVIWKMAQKRADSTKLPGRSKGNVSEYIARLILRDGPENHEPQTQGK